MKKLSAVLVGGDQVDAANGEEEVNETDLDKSVAEFSADEEEEVAATEVAAQAQVQIQAQVQVTVQYSISKQRKKLFGPKKVEMPKKPRKT